jgi:hypothetical protein
VRVALPSQHAPPNEGRVRSDFEVSNLRITCRLFVLIENYNFDAIKMKVFPGCCS